MKEDPDRYARAARLQEAILSRFSSVAEAASELGYNKTTLQHHSNGRRTADVPTLAEYADRLGIRLHWLATGRGPMQNEPRGVVIPVTGLVGAGATVEKIGEPLTALPPPIIIRENTIEGLTVEGTSQSPRFNPGEIILYDPGYTNPESLLGQFAVVQTRDDGRRLVKRLSRGRKPDTYNLASLGHGIPDEENVYLLKAHRIYGVIFP